MPKRVSMRAIAQRAGVSAMTVSLALRGSPEVSEATRDAIQALAKEMGYQPDPVLRALIHYRRTEIGRDLSNTIAFINNTSHPSALPLNEIYRLTFDGASERGAQLGYKVEEFWLRQPGLTPKRASTILRTRGIRGLILAPQERPRERMELQWENFSSVAIGLTLENPRFHIVINNMFKSMTLCVQKLIDLGYRRIGLAIRREQDERVGHRYTGAYLAMCACFEIETIPCFRPETLSVKPFLDWFYQHRPEVVIGTEPAFGAYLREAGLKIPQEVGFASIFSTAALRGYSHINGNAMEIGRVAAEIVSSMIDHNESGIPKSPRQVSIEPEWVSCGSVRRLRNR